MVTVVAAAPMPLVAIHNICCKIWALFLLMQRTQNLAVHHKPSTCMFYWRNCSAKHRPREGDRNRDKGAGRDVDRGTRAGTRFSVKSNLVMRLSVFVHTKECKLNKPKEQKTKNNGHVVVAAAAPMPLVAIHNTSCKGTIFFCLCSIPRIWPFITNTVRVCFYWRNCSTKL